MAVLNTNHDAFQETCDEIYLDLFARFIFK